MPVVNQDFVTFVGDSVSPIFTVVDANGNAVNIAGITGITWSAVRNLNDSAVLSKTMAAGQISILGGGTTGQFQVTILAADTAALSGWYMHTAALLGAGSSVTTVTVGRMQVGQAPNWTWDPGSVGVDSLYTVRQLIGDVKVSDQLQSDQQIRWALSIYSNEWLAGAECARNISAAFSTQIDVVQGELKTNYSQRAKAFRLLALDLEQRGYARGGATVYVGGTSIQDKTNNVENTDRVPPQFMIGMFDNLLPEAPVGHQANATLGQSDDQSGVAFNG
jgi:hypothetical protein